MSKPPPKQGKISVDSVRGEPIRGLTRSTDDGTSCQAPSLILKVFGAPAINSGNRAVDGYGLDGATGPTPELQSDGYVPG